jgi:hypothetical protein
MMSQLYTSRYAENIEKKFPYTVNYPRTHEWYDNKGDWYQLSGWCDSMIGKDNWEYIHEKFRFKTESHKMWFKLRWS